jgi:hypothetical protein
VLYSRTLEALGYSRNQAPFLELARRLPWTAVQEAGLPREREQRETNGPGLVPCVGGATGQPARPSHRRRGFLPAT